MKKIIYSLVIMIAAGSLITSCIQPVEPDGIYDLREAKARYYDALSQLRAAEAEVQKAEATYRQALAGVENARAELLKAQAAGAQAQADYQKLVNAAKEAENAYLKQQLEAQAQRLADSLKLEAEQLKTKLENEKLALETATQAYKDYLRSVALAAKNLTAAEQTALNTAIADYTAALTNLTTAQNAYATALQKLNSDKYMWDSNDSQYYGYKEYYQRQIDRANAEIERLNEKLANVPAIEELEKWQEELEKYHQDSIADEYSKAALVNEYAQYFVNNIHDRVADFDAFVDEWIDEHTDASGNFVKQPTALTSAVKDTLAGKATKAPLPVILDADGNVDKTADVYKAGGKSFTIDYVNVPLTEGGFSPATWNKITYLLGSYKNIGPADATLNMIDVVTGTPDTLRIVANQSMRNLILGEEGKEVKQIAVPGQTYKVDYGLYGVYSILDRQWVLAKKSGSDMETLKTNLDNAQKAWEEDFVTLQAGFAAYEPFTTAVSALETANSNDSNGVNAMVDAVKALKAELDKVDGVAQAGFTYNDSLAIFNAFVAFAKARDNYLEYTFTPGDAYDSTVFRYATGVDSGSKLIVDSTKKFSELVFQDLRDKVYDYDWSAAPATPLTKYGTANNGLANIANQLFPGSAIATQLQAATINTSGFTVADINAALFNTYAIDDYANPTKVTYVSDGTDYVDPAVTAAEAAVTKSRTDWIDLFNAFWGESFANTIGATEETTFFNTLKAADKTKLVKAVEDGTINVAVSGTKKYNLAYLTDVNKDDFYKAFNDPVALIDATVTPTEALSAVLTSLDPNTNGTEGQFVTAITDSRLLYGSDLTTETEFLKYMKAQAAYADAQNENVEGDLQILKAFIEKVEAAFEADAANADKLDSSNGSLYAQAVAALKRCQTLEKNYNTAKTKYDNFQTELVKFVGADSKGKALIANPATLKFNTVNNAVADIMYKLVTGSAVSLIDVDGGEWNDTKVGGQVADKLAELFVDMPAKLKDWKDRDDAIAEGKLHNTIATNALEPVYQAAAIAKQYNENASIVAANGGTAPTTWTAIMTAYNNAVDAWYSTLATRISAAQTAIDGYTKNLADVELGIDALTIAERTAQANYDAALFDLQEAQDAFDRAKDYLDYVLEIIKGLQSQL